MVVAPYVMAVAIFYPSTLNRVYDRLSLREDTFSVHREDLSCCASQLKSQEYVHGFLFFLPSEITDGMVVWRLPLLHLYVGCQERERPSRACRHADTFTGSRDFYIFGRDCKRIPKLLFSL